MGELAKLLNLESGKWKLSPENIPNNGDHAGTPLTIFTCVGNFGVGKSFLQNMLLGFIKHVSYW